MIGSRHQVVATSGQPGELAGVRGPHAAVALAADVGHGAEGHCGGVVADVQEAMGGRKTGAIQQVAGPAQGGHAPGPLEEVRGDVLEKGAGRHVRSAEDGVGPVAAGADAPDVEGEAAGALAQEVERRLHVAVEEDVRRTAGAEAPEVDGQRVVAGGAEGLDATPEMEVGFPPDQPGMEQEHGAAGAALRRKPGRRERAASVAPRYSGGSGWGTLLSRGESARK